MHLLFPSWKERAALVRRTVQSGAVSIAGAFRTGMLPRFGEPTWPDPAFPCALLGVWRLASPEGPAEARGVDTFPLVPQVSHYTYAGSPIGILNTMNVIFKEGI